MRSRTPYDLALDKGLTFPMYLGIMVTWSPEDVDVGVQSLLVQIYPILLSTLSSVKSQQLSQTDATFALDLSSSPLTVYVVVASVGDLFGIKTGLYKRIKSHRPIIRALGAIVLPLWTGLSLALYLLDGAFTCTRQELPDHCISMTFTGWLLRLLVLFGYSFSGGLDPIPGLGFAIISLPIAYFLFKDRVQVNAGVRAHWNGTSNPWRKLLVPWIFVSCAWYVPIIMGPRLAVFNPTKVDYRPQP